MNRVQTFILISLWIAVLAGTAQAERSSAATRSQAQQHFRNGRVAFNLGQYDEAVAEFAAAYRVQDDPVYLYNIAQAHRLAGRPEEAIRFYRSYLRNASNAPNRKEVEGKIDELEKSLEQQHKTRSMPPVTVFSHGEAIPTDPPGPIARVPTPPSAHVATPAAPGSSPSASPQETSNGLSKSHSPPFVSRPVPSPDKRRFGRSFHRSFLIGGGVLVGIGVAMLGAGIGSQVRAGQISSELSAIDRDQGVYDPALDRAGRRDNLLGAVFLGVGGAVATVGSALVAIGATRERARHHPKLTLLPVLGPHTAGAALHGAFE